MTEDDSFFNKSSKNGSKKDSSKADRFSKRDVVASYNHLHLESDKKLEKLSETNSESEETKGNRRNMPQDEVGF